MTEQPQAVRVALVDDSTPPKSTPRKLSSSYGTFVLTAAQNATRILPAVDYRREAIVMAVDTAITIASDSQGAAGGVGTYVPQGAQWVIKDEGDVWAGAAGLIAPATSRVSVSAIGET